MRKFNECIARRNFAIYYLRVEDYGIFPPKQVRVIALNDLVVGTLICGPKLFSRRPSHSHMFFYNSSSLCVPHQVTPDLIALGSDHQSWFNYELLQEKTNDCIHPSCLFDSTSDSSAYFPNDNTTTHIVRHFLPNSYTVEEVFVPIGHNKRLIRNSNPGIHRWTSSTTVGDVSSQAPLFRANIISNVRSCP